MSAPDYLPLYREMAAGGDNFHGLSIVQHSRVIGKLINRLGAKTILDYGCGRGDAYKQPHRLHRDWGLRWWDVTLYDPSFPEHNEEPGKTEKFDGVLCSDVLEHVPEEQVDEFVARLFHHAKKFVWASVCCRPAKKCFPGTEINLHCTVRPFEWWQEVFQRHAGGIEFCLVETP